MRKAKLALVLKLVVTGVLFYLVLESIDLAQAVEQLDQLNPALIVGGLSLVFVQVGLASLRWGMLSRVVLGERLTNRLAVVLTLIGLFFNQFLVSTIGGDAVRGWGAHLRGMSVRNAFVSVALDRMTGLASLALLVALGLPFLVPLIEERAVVGGIALSVALILVVIALFPFLDRVLGRLPQVRVVRVLASIAADVRSTLVKPRLAGSVVALSLVAHFLNVLIAVVISSALGEPLSLLAAFAVIPTVTLIAALPISIAGWGVREGAMVVVAGFVGMSAETAVVLSLLMGLLNLAAGLPGGLLWMVTMRKAPPRQASLLATGQETLKAP